MRRKMTEQTKQEPQQEQAQEPTKTPMIDAANQAAERLEAANKQKEALLAREEELASKRILGGQSEAGIEPDKPKEESAKEYADRVMRGGK